MKLFDMNYRLRDKVDRHMSIIFRHLTLKRFINISLSLLEYSFRMKHLNSKPFLLKIEPSSFCNLKCLGCRTEVEKFKFKHGMITYHNFESIIEGLKDYLVEVSLYIWGEPLMHKKEICKMVELLSKHNIGSVISTNGHFLSKDIADGLVDAGLDKLIIAIDGTTQDSYSKIRTGGHLELVMNNLAILAQSRIKKRSTTPLIEWQFIRTDFNKDEIPVALETARQFEVDYFTLMPDWGRRESDQNTKQARSKAHKSRMKVCRWLWFAAAIQWNGDIYPCCHVARDERNSFGRREMLQCWNSEAYKTSRGKFAYFNRYKKGDTVCFRCPM